MLEQRDTHAPFEALQRTERERRPRHQVGMSSVPCTVPNACNLTRIRSRRPARTHQLRGNGPELGAWPPRAPTITETARLAEFNSQYQFTDLHRGQRSLHSFSPGRRLRRRGTIAPLISKPTRTSHGRTHPPLCTLTHQAPRPPPHAMCCRCTEAHGNACGIRTPSTLHHSLHPSCWFRLVGNDSRLVYVCPFARGRALQASAPGQHLPGLHLPGRLSAHGASRHSSVVYAYDAGSVVGSGAVALMEASSARSKA